jgi:hypothetical protein
MATKKTGIDNSKRKAPTRAARAASAQLPPRLSAEELPRQTLQSTLALASALHSTYAGMSATWDELCNQAGLGASTNNTKYVFWAAKAYGVINKEASGQVFTLSETGRKIVAPTYEGEDREGILKAVLTPTVLSKFYTDYNGHPIPGSAHLPNVLETRYGVPRDRVGEAMNIILENAEFAGIVEKMITGEQRIKLSAPSLPRPSAQGPALASDGPDAAGGEKRGSDEMEWSKVCFLITPIGADGSEERRHADMMLKHLMGPVAAQFDLKVVRADKIDKSGLITQQIFEHLVKARLCVADLSFSNPNVFYELGVRHICKLPTIQVIRKGDKIPFDVAQGRTIIVDTLDLYTIMDRFDSARRELAEHVKEILTNKDAADDNPVCVYLPGLSVTIPD